MRASPTLRLRPLVALAVVLGLSACAPGVPVSPPPTEAVVALGPPMASARPTLAATPSPTTAPTAPAPQVAPTATARPRPSTSPLAIAAVPADDGARIVAVTVVDLRTRDLTIDSPALGWPAHTPHAVVKVRLLLPSLFDAQPAARWPVLFLLCGADGDHTEWTKNTDVERLTASSDLLVVMPDAGGGWYSNWWNAGKGGPPAWETFHLVELRQLLERNWRAGSKRAVAGQSMGGLGAMDYAARHPGLFVAAAAFSGVLDPIGGHARGWQLGAPARMWGDLPAQAAVWKSHDPADRAAGLARTALYVAYGDGQPGLLDPPGAKRDPQESEVAIESRAFVGRVEGLHVPATVTAYGPGTHSWPYFQRDLHRWLPFLLRTLGE